MPERLRSFTTRRYINPRYLYLNLYAALRYMLIANVIKNCNLSNEKATLAACGGCQIVALPFLKMLESLFNPTVYLSSQCILYSFVKK